MGIAFKTAVALLLAANAACAAWLARAPEPADPARPVLAPKALEPMSESALARARQERSREVAPCVSLSGMQAKGRDEALAALSARSGALSFEEARAQAWLAVGPKGAREGPFGSQALAAARARELGAPWRAQRQEAPRTYEVRLGPWLRKDVPELGKIAKAWGAAAAAECDANQRSQWLRAKAEAR